MYHKALNRSTVSLSYSCMPNIGMIIKNKNTELLSNDTNSEKHCSCRKKNNCPLNGRCLTKSLVYEAEVKTDTESFRYIGLCEGDFKTRYNTHMSSFRNKKYSNSTELSKKIWTLKNDNIKHTVSWKTVQTSRARKCGSDRCNLCLAEKFHILTSKNNGLLHSYYFFQYFSMFMFLVL